MQMITIQFPYEESMSFDQFAKTWDINSLVQTKCLLYLMAFFLMGYYTACVSNVAPELGSVLTGLYAVKF